MRQPILSDGDVMLVEVLGNGGMGTTQLPCNLADRLSLRHILAVKKILVGEPLVRAECRCYEKVLWGSTFLITGSCVTPFKKGYRIKDSVPFFNLEQRGLNRRSDVRGTRPMGAFCARRKNRKFFQATEERLRSEGA